jgi:hypothetical protein
LNKKDDCLRIVYKSGEKSTFTVLGDDLAADVELMESRNLIRSDGSYQFEIDQAYLL